MILRTTLMEKEFSTGCRERYYDLCQFKTGFAVQRNGKTMYGRLDSYGAEELWAVALHDAKKQGWQVAEERIDNMRYANSGWF